LILFLLEASVPRLISFVSRRPHSGSRFDKEPTTSYSKYDVFFGSKPSTYTEVRCVELAAAVVPSRDGSDEDQGEEGGRMLSLVRKLDGLTIPSRVAYVG
jgi:hypothetical protein